MFAFIKPTNAHSIYAVIQFLFTATCFCGTPPYLVSLYTSNKGNYYTGHTTLNAEERYVNDEEKD